MRRNIIYSFIAIVVVLSYAFYDDNPKVTPVATYVGTQACVCHNSTHVTPWKNTLHAQIHMNPNAGTVRPIWTGSVSMGASYGNATVALSLVGNVYKATLTPSSGSPVTYDIVYTYGGGWKQRYLIKISNSYYMLPIQYNLTGYKNYTGGSWVSYNPGNWFNADGTLKPIDNTFRKKAYDKNCIGCHMTGYKPQRVVAGSDTSWVATWANGSDTTNNKVGCENCHGPGSDHITSPSKQNIFGPERMNQAGLSRQQEVCGQCHFRGASTGLTYEYPWKESVDSIYQPGQILTNFIAPWQNYFNVLGGPGTWPDTMTARQHHQQWQDMSYSAHNNIMNCYKCHNTHAVTNYPHQLKLSNDSNSICLQCHTYFGTPGNPNIPNITSHTKHTYDPLNTNQTGGTSRCSKCHMTKVAVTALSYDIHSHNWKVVRPIKTLQKLGVSSPTQGMLNSCAVSCHRNPGGSTSNVPTLGVGFDSTLTNWRQVTDSLLADTLNRWFNNQNWIIGIQPISSEIPNRYELGQNFPNPFNPFTRIHFYLPKTENVSVKIYDITGREVYSLLLNERLTPGKYEVTWRAINNYGDDVASGVYFYSITAGDFRQAKKMILIR
jgi:predicted CXXCH cytochrome family protein